MQGAIIICLSLLLDSSWVSYYAKLVQIPNNLLSNNLEKKKNQGFCDLLTTSNRLKYLLVRISAMA
jgi:hypothetical protein